MKTLLIGLAFCLSLSNTFGQSVVLSGQSNTFLNGTYSLHSCATGNVFSNGKNTFRKQINVFPPSPPIVYEGTNYYVYYAEIKHINSQWELSFLAISGMSSTSILVSSIEGNVTTSFNPPCGVAFGGTLSSSTSNCYEATCTPPTFPTLPNNQQTYTKCSTETLTIMPSCATGTAKWFECTDIFCFGTTTPRPCTALQSGNLVTTASTTTTYIVGCQNECGMINYRNVVVNVTPSPNMPTFTPPFTQTICSGTSASLSATCVSSTVRWYDGITLAGTGSPFNTGALMSNKTYSVKCFNGTCESYTHPNLAYVNVTPTPLAPTTSDITTCPGISLSLSATCASQNSVLKWYDAQTGGNFLGNGTYNTGVLNESTDYYVGCSVNNCVGNRTKLSVIMTSIEAPNSYSPDLSICQFTTVTVTASCGAGVPTWYDNDYYYSPIGTGTSLVYSVDFVFDLYVSCETPNCRSELRNISFLIKEQISHQPEEINGNPTENTILTFDGCQAGEVTWNIHDGNVNENYDVFIASRTGNPLITRLKGIYFIYASCSNAVCGLPERLNFHNCFENQFSFFSPDHDFNSSLQIIRPYIGGSIEATNKISGTAKTLYEANVIELKPGFKAEAKPNGAVFIAKSGGGCSVD